MSNQDIKNIISDEAKNLTKLTDDEVDQVTGGNSIEDALSMNAQNPFEDADRTDAENINKKVRDSV